jgi:hypothetical protein
MSLHNARRPYFLADIEPTIAVAEAARWEREAVIPPPASKPASHDLMKEARVMRSAYQRELMRRFAEWILSWLHPPRVSRAAARARRLDGG